MKFQKGKPRPPGAGRKKGSLNKRTKELVLAKDILSKKDRQDPLDFLYHVMMGERVFARIGTNLQGDDFVEQEILPTLEHRLSAAKELAQYLHPKLKAIEHAGKGGEPFVIQIVKFDAPQN